MALARYGLRRFVVGSWLPFALGLTAACGSHPGAASVQSIPDAASVEAGVEAGATPAPDAGDEGGDETSDDSSPTPQPTFIRVAQLARDLPPIDLCIAPHGTTAFQGPLIGQLATSLGVGDPDAAPAGIAYTQVSAYLSVAPGPYDIRIVPAGASDCSSPPAITADPGAGTDADADAGADAGADAATDAATGPDADAALPDTTNLAAFAANAYATLLIAGSLTPNASAKTLSVTAMVDDSALAGAVALRAINALPDAPSLDFGLGSSSTGWLPLFTDVAFGSASSHAGPHVGVLDGNGYLPIGPLSSQIFSARVSSDEPGDGAAPESDAGVATGDVVTAKSLTIGVGSIATVFAISGLDDDGGDHPSLLLCEDNSPSGGLLSDCSIAK